MSRRISPVIPGFGLTLGYTLVYLSLLVLIPLGALFLKTTELSWAQFIAIVSAPRVLAALKLSFGTAFVAAVLNGVIGTLLAWVLVRYRFPGRKIIEAMIDLPFALPTAVAGIALTALYAPNGPIGQFATELGFKIAYSPLGITLALTFVTLPFVLHNAGFDQVAIGMAMTPWPLTIAVTAPLAWWLEPMRVQWTPALFGSLTYLVVANSIVAMTLFKSRPTPSPIL